MTGETDRPDAPAAELAAEDAPLPPTSEPFGDDEGTVAERRHPRRRCIATGTVTEKERLLRFVAAPDGQVVLDIGGKLPGRGAYVLATKAALATAVKKGRLQRALPSSARVAPDLERHVVLALVLQAIDLLGLARRSGQAVAGFEKVQAALRSGRVGKSGPVALLFCAGDAGQHGREKIIRLVGTVRLAEALSSADLGAAFGRDTAVHVAVAAGGLAQRLGLVLDLISGLTEPQAPSRAQGRGHPGARHQAGTAPPGSAG